MKSGPSSGGPRGRITAVCEVSYKTAEREALYECESEHETGLSWALSKAAALRRSSEVQNAEGRCFEMHCVQKLLTDPQRDRHRRQALYIGQFGRETTLGI